VANFQFQSTAYQWLVISGAKAQYKGTGTVNSAGNYGFILTAIDGALLGKGVPDKFRLKIWDNSNNGAIIYDNQMGASDTTDPTTVLGGGDIIVHKNQRLLLTISLTQHNRFPDYSGGKCRKAEII
jgi:hypothetical protein